MGYTSVGFIKPLAPSSRDLNPVDCRIWGKMQQRLYQTKVHDVDELGLKQRNVWRMAWRKA